MKNYIYKDLNLSFIKHPSTSDVVASYDIEAIKKSVRHILKTNKGEKLFNPEFGADLHGLLFELLTPGVKILAKRRIIEEIRRWEPRVDVTDVQLTQSNEMGGIVIVLFFSLTIQPDVKSNVTISLERAR